MALPAGGGEAGLKRPSHRPAPATQCGKAAAKEREKRHFWSAKGAEYFEAIRLLERYAVTLQSQHHIADLETNLRCLGIYFDTVQVVDPIHVPLPPEKFSEYLDGLDHAANKLILLERLVLLYRTRRLALADVDRPILLIAPDVSGQQDDEEQAASYIGETVFGIPDLSPKELLRLLAKPENELDQMIKFRNRLSSLQQRFGKPPGELVWTFNPETGSLGSAFGGVSAVTGTQLISAIWKYLESTFYSFRETLAAATVTEADPVIHSGNRLYFEWFRRRLCQAQDADNEEQVAVEALLDWRLQFLQALTLEDLLEIREAGVFEELRRQLRVSRDQYLRAHRQGMAAAVDVFARRFLEQVEAARLENGQAIRSARQSLWKTAALFAVSATIGFLPFAASSARVLSLVGTSLGVLGGVSLVDLIRRGTQTRRSAADCEHSPMAILWGARRRHRQSRITG